jgi:elongation factor Ts
MACKFDGGDMTVEQALTDKIFTIRENLSIRRFLIVKGALSTYIHGGGVTGVIVKFDADDEVAAKPEFAEMAKNVALQVAAMNCQYTYRSEVPQSVLDEEKEILITQIKNDPKNSKKPPEIIEKMVTGRIEKFYETNCLADQAYVKDDSMTVEKYVESVAKNIGPVKLIAFYRYDKGEGLQKREDNFAEEIAKINRIPLPAAVIAVGDGIFVGIDKFHAHIMTIAILPYGEYGKIAHVDNHNAVCLRILQVESPSGGINRRCLRNIWR